MRLAIAIAIVLGVIVSVAAQAQVSNCQTRCYTAAGITTCNQVCD